MVGHAVTEIRPYERVGDIEFGMSALQVRGILGYPLNVMNNTFGEEVLEFGAMQVCVSPATGVTEVGLFPTARPTISGVEIFKDPCALRRLRVLDDAPKEAFGFAVFLGLGITVTGLHDNDENQRAVTAFAKGRWDRMSSQMKPLP